MHSRVYRIFFLFHVSMILAVPSYGQVSAVTKNEWPTTLERSHGVKVNLGPGVNSVFEETKPIISPDGKQIYFARKCSFENIGGSSDAQDIYVSQSSDGIRWDMSKNIGTAINTSRADNLCAVLDDNRFMLFIRHGKSRGHFVLKKSTDPGFTQRTGPEIENESAFLEASLSYDENVLLFTAKNKTNIFYQRNSDERDIYVSIRTGNSWSAPVNLGSVINSGGDEFSPFLAADGRTLYFASNGRAGHGDADVFMSRRVGHSWDEWTEPVNAGDEINSNRFDAYFTVSRDGSHAYMVSYHNTFGKGDIVKVSLPVELRPLEEEPVQPSRLDHIFFEKGTAKIIAASKASLESLVALLKNDASIAIELHGHTDNVGTLAALNDLSKKRVNAVRQYLIHNGIAQGRIKSKTFGGLRPANENSSEENRMKNRRVELIIRKF